MKSRNIYRESYKITKRYGTSYFIANLLLQKKDRKHVYALYSLCRFADDLVDVDEGEPGQSKQAMKNLQKFKEDVFRAIETQAAETPMLKAITQTWNELCLPKEFLERFFRSMEMDLTVSRYDTFDDLLVYMDGSAAVIGEMVLPILEKDRTKHEFLRPYARALGNAFQFTNFIRDVKEDLERDRVYLPEKDFREHGIDPNDFLYDERFAHLVAFEIERARGLYFEAFPGVVTLRGRPGACVRTAYRLYGGINNAVLAQECDVLTSRARISTVRKNVIAAREFIRRQPQSMSRDCFVKYRNDQ
ncbi:MAG TPA: phytoene/squalene synthase family protein [Acidimicrobiia bacterium]|nr:phytoene/squalene synthase family protein [Acidimicrobiia bacterium]